MPAPGVSVELERPLFKHEYYSGVVLGRDAAKLPVNAVL